MCGIRNMSEKRMWCNVVGIEFEFMLFIDELVTIRISLKTFGIRMQDLKWQCKAEQKEQSGLI